MISFLTAFLLLLLPILAILIVRVRTRQRVLYSHTYLRPLSYRPLQEFLFRTFQLYFDAAFDVLLALVLALLLSGLLDPFARKTAVCLDGSFSMRQGGEDSPLERALGLLAEGKAGAGRYRLFLLAFDPQKGRPALLALGRSPRKPSRSIMRERLAAAPSFFSADPRELGALFRRGYRRVVYITDRLRLAAPDLEVIEVGEGPKSFFYPLSVAYREEEKSFRIRILRSRFDGPLEVQRFSEEDDVYRKFATVPGEPGSALSELTIRNEGLFRLSGEVESGRLDFLLPLVRPTISVQPKGEFSTLLADVLPGVKKAPGGIVLQDIPWDPRKPSTAEKALRSLPGILTVIPESGSYTVPPPYIHPLEESFSQPSYAEIPPELISLGGKADRVFFQDPSRFRDARTPLVYLSVLQRSRPAGPFLQDRMVPRGARLSHSQSGSTSYLYEAAQGLRALNLPPEEFFPLSDNVELRFPSPAPPRFFHVLLLLVFYVLKLLFLIRFGPFTRAQ